MTAVLTMPDGIERRTLRIPRGEVVASYAAPRPENDRGIAVLLITGYVGCKEDFWAVLPGIAGAGYHAWTYDQIGQYESDGPLDPDAYTVALLAEDARAVLTQVRARLGPRTPVPVGAGVGPTGWSGGPGPAGPAESVGGAAHLVGHCLGGFVARAAALADPAAVRSVAFLGCGPALNEPKQRAGLAELDRKLEGGTLQLLWPTLKRVVPERDTGLREFWFRKLDTANPGFMHGTARAMAEEGDRSAELRAAGVPALVVQGKRDRRVWPKAKFAAMAADLRAEHVVIAGAAHSPSMEQPEATLAALLRFWPGTHPATGEEVPA